MAKRTRMDPRSLVGLAALGPLLCVALACRAPWGAAGPTVVAELPRIAALTFDAVTIELDVVIANPVDAQLGLLNLSWSLVHAGRTLATGGAPTQGGVAPGGSRTIGVSIELATANLLAAVPGLRRGALVDYQVELEVVVDAPGSGPLTFPLVKRGELPLPAAPRVKLAGVEWRAAADGGPPAAVLDLSVRSANEFPLELDRIAFALELAGQPAGGGPFEVETRLPSAADARLLISLPAAPAGPGPALLPAGEEVEYRLAGTTLLTTPWATLEAPFEATGRVQAR